jgi:sn-glycerol 3-phosphate transport system ATP-binding protein
VQAGYGATLLIATNDQRTAALLSHQVAILLDGRIVQVGPFTDVYERPATLGVARLVGDPPMTLLPGRVVTAPGRRPRLVAGGLERATHDPAVARLAGREVTLGLRPEDVDRAEAGGAHATGEVVAVALLGADGLATVRLDGGGDLVVRLPRPLPRRGDTVALELSRVHVFGPDDRLVTVAR